MASVTIVTMTCDFPHIGDDFPASKTVTIGWEDATLEADACDEHAQAISDALGPYIECMRTVTPASLKVKAPQNGTRGKRTTEKRNLDRAIRQWAKDTGLGISDRGRIPVAIIAQYDAAH